MTRTLRRAATVRGPEQASDDDERLWWMGQAMSHLIDEVAYLRESVATLESAAGRSTHTQAEARVRFKMEQMFSSAGAVPEGLWKWDEYLSTPSELARRLIPDDARRQDLIEQLGQLT